MRVLLGRSRTRPLSMRVGGQQGGSEVGGGERVRGDYCIYLKIYYMIY